MDLHRNARRQEVWKEREAKFTGKHAQSDVWGKGGILVTRIFGGRSFTCDSAVLIPSNDTMDNENNHLGLCS